MSVKTNGTVCLCVFDTPTHMNNAALVEPRERHQSQHDSLRPIKRVIGAVLSQLVAPCHTSDAIHIEHVRVVQNNVVQDTGQGFDPGSVIDCCRVF